MKNERSFRPLQSAWRLARLLDDRSPEQRGCAIVLYRVDFALWQEWHEEAVRAARIRKLRTARERIAA